MEPVAANYKPGLTNPSKYLTYIDYFREHVFCGDFKALEASLKYDDIDGVNREVIKSY